MKRRRHRGGADAPDQTPHVSTPAQEDESDILEEVGAEADEENGGLRADVETVREIGAMDAASVIENRRLEKAVKKKRGNVAGVSFNTDDVLVHYDNLVKAWTAGTMHINVRRCTGAPVQHVLTNHPRSGAELYRILQGIHGTYEEADYEIKFIDSQLKIFRGQGRITMPDTRPQTQQGQPMSYQPPPGYPPGYPPPGYGAQSWQPQQPAQPAAAPAQAGAPQVFVQPPAGPDLAATLTGFQQLFGVFQEMTRQMTPPPSAAPSAVPQMAMPPPPATLDMPSMMAWFQQMLEMARSMQPHARAGTPAPTPAPAMPQMAAQPTMGVGYGMGPPMQPPEGMMWIPNFGFVPLEALVRAIGGGRGPHSPTMGGGSTMGASAHRPPPTPTPRERSAAEQFREAISVVRTANAVAREFAEMTGVGGGGAVAAEPENSEDDENPIRILEAGGTKLLLNKEDGKLRVWETGLANIDKVFKWAGEQVDAVRKGQEERRAREAQPAQQLPPGYVEVGPGYTPPEGWVPVPVDPRTIPRTGPAQTPPARPSLPQPPQVMPPPLQPTSTNWGMPTIDR